MDFSFCSESFLQSWLQLANHVSNEKQRKINSPNVNPYPALDKIILNFDLKNFENCLYCRSMPVLNLENAINRFFEKIALNIEEEIIVENKIVFLTEILGIIFNFCQEYRFLNTKKDQNIEDFVWLVTTSHIFYAHKLFYHGVNVLPFDLIKKKYELSELDRAEEIKEKVDSFIKEIKKWEESVKEKEKSVLELEKRLEDTKQTYDFILLNKGFKELYEQKKQELKERREGYSQFGASLICIPLAVIVGIVILILTGYESKLASMWFLTIPITTLMLFLFYFTRVGLQHVRSVQSQMMQLELRMALCQFIHNYAEDSEKLHAKNKAGFEKFENIIFSPLVSSDDKIPTTFDGMEQLAKLVSEFRKS